MLTLTTTTLSNHTLLLASRLDEDNMPALVFINWLNENNWQDSKSIEKVNKHYKLIDDTINFKDQNSLSARNPAESLLLTNITQLNQYLTGER